MDRNSIVVGMVFGFFIGLPIGLLLIGAHTSTVRVKAQTVGLPLEPQYTKNTEEVEWIDHKGMLRRMTVHRTVE